MSMINSKAVIIQESIIAAKMVLSLIFPDYQLKVLPNLLLFTKILEDGTKQQGTINRDNFEEFKSILKVMFCLDLTSSSEFNPADKKAAKIAQKLLNRRKILEKKQNKESSGEIALLFHYALILSLGNHHTYPELMDYTVYQITTAFNKYIEKYNYDIWLKAKLAGAENLDDVKNWLTPGEEKSNQPRLTYNRRIDF